MRIETKEIKIYKYDELTEEQKQKVLNNLSDININFEWWDFIYEDAENIGLKIKGFDLDRGNYCEIKWIDSAYEVANKILKEHGDQCDTYKNAKQFIQDWDQLVEKYSDGINKSKVMEGNEDKFDDEADELEEEFLSNLAKDYLKMLKDEYEYKISREAIEETININDYEFTDDGNIY